MLYKETIAVCCNSLRERTVVVLTAVSLTRRDFLGYEALIRIRTVKETPCVGRILDCLMLKLVLNPSYLKV